MNSDTHEIVAVDQTFNDVSDVSEKSHPLDQIDADLASITADGAYDGGTPCDALIERHSDAAVIIPTRVTAIEGRTRATQRALHIAAIAEQGRMGWPRRSGYHRRSLIETAMFRYRSIIGRRLHVRNLPNQPTDAKTGRNVLNRMTDLGMPIFVRVR